MLEKEEVQESVLYAESIFGRETKKGLVKLSLGLSDGITISPNEARHFAKIILEAAEAAETDELVMTWLQKGLGVKDEGEAVLILRDFRDMRDLFRERKVEEN